MHPSKKTFEIDFDFMNTAAWEYLFLPSSRRVGGVGVGVGAGGDAAEEADYDEGRGGDEGKDESDGDPATGSIVRAFDAPPSWVSSLELERPKYLMRYPPHGKRTVQFYRAKVDYFARGVSAQALAMRIVQFLDEARTVTSEVHEWFENRKDKMYKRIRYFLGNARFVEYYHPGSVGEIKQWTEHPGKKVDVEFHVHGRLDRLARREEILGTAINEQYSGRSDNLAFRSVVLTVDKAAAGARQFTLTGGTLAPELFVLKMTQAFDRDPTAAEGQDVMKRSFFVREGKAIVRFHFGKSQVTGKVKTYLHTRGPSVPGVSELAISQEVGIEEDPDQLQEAVALERECYASVKSNFQQMLKIAEYRAETEAGVGMDLSVFDRALDKAYSDLAGGERGGTAGSTSKGAGLDGSTSDYLTPFLRNIKDPARLTKEEALEIRQTCMDALRMRLVERANIIQNRLNEENAKLGRKQEQFQRSQREGDLSTEEYEKYCTEAMFRIQILEQRLLAHGESAPKKFAELDQRISNDPRLRVLRS